MKVNASVIAIQDKARVLLFQHDGKFIGKVDKMGRGSGEYLSMEDFDVRDSLVYVLSRVQKRISVYDWNGAFVRKVDLDDWYQHLKIIDDNLMLLSSESANEKGVDFVVLDYHSSECIEMFFPFEENEGITFGDFNPFCGTFIGGYYLIRPFDYTIYRLNKSEFKPYCQFRFNTKEQLDLEENYIKLSEQSSNKNVVQYLGLYEEYQGSIYMKFNLFEDGAGIGSYLYKVEADGKTRLMRIYETYPESYPYVSAPYGVYDGSFYSIRPALDVLNIEDMYGLSLFHNKGLTDESNHVVFFHKLK